MKRLALGVMSGTSGDGVSVSLARFKEHSFELLHYATYPYPSPIVKKIARGFKLTAPEISILNVTLGEFFSSCILKSIKTIRIPRQNISVVGSHGHTIYHGPYDKPRNSLQIGEPSIIAERTGIPVIADFRMRAIAQGGEGAPLIPFFDKYFYGQGPTRALQNIGGMGNVTVVGKNIAPIYFDTGPGNCLMDWAVRKLTHDRRTFDKAGKIAARGKINMKAVVEMARHPYFKKLPPKSTGRELFNERFIPKHLRNNPTPNLVATLTYFTSYTISQSYSRFIPHSIKEVIVSGGGALNNELTGHLRNLLSPIPVRPIMDLGIPAQAKEPIAFSFFALRAIQGKTNCLPNRSKEISNTTSILGKIIPQNKYAYH